jgi:hypothetical protein
MAAITRTLGADRNAKAWETSDDNCDAEIAARTVQVGPNTTGLLVTQVVGSEYRFRSHALYLVRDAKLEISWNFDEDELGSHWTTTTVLPGMDGGQDLAFIDVSRAVIGKPAKVSAVRLRFDPATRHFISRPLPDPAASLFLLQVGRFKRAKDASDARRYCLHELELLHAGLFPGLKLPTFFLGVVFARRDDAEAALAPLVSCSDAPKASVSELAFPRTKSHDKHY